MNNSFLYTYLAEQMHTHLRFYNRDFQLSEEYILRNDLPDTFTVSDKLPMLLCQDIREPRLCSVNNLLSYLSVPVEDKICVIGPVSVCENAVQSYTLPQLLIPDELIGKLYPAGSNLLIRMGVLLYNLFCTEPVDLIECFNRNCMSAGGTAPMEQAARHLFYHEEYGENHNPFELEQREMKGIETGNIEQLKKSWSEDFSGHLEKLSPDPERHAKYLSIINVALSARAAIRGGLPFELAFSLSDAYCQQIDALSRERLFDLEALIHNIQLTFTNLVARQKSKTHALATEPPMITRAKNYIFSHLHGRLTVQDVAEAVAVHPNYLNRTFKQSTGLTIHETIMGEKVYMAANLLTYSDYTYIEIANYLGFTSQSHLGDVFKKHMGMTLHQYRVTYKKF